MSERRRVLVRRDRDSHVARRRLHALIAGGCTTVEIKSGYGLDLETELKMLEAAKALETYTLRGTDGSKVGVSAARKISFGQEDILALIEQAKAAEAVYARNPDDARPRAQRNARARRSGRDHRGVRRPARD